MLYFLHSDTLAQPPVMVWSSFLALGCFRDDACSCVFTLFPLTSVVAERRVQSTAAWPLHASFRTQV